MLVSGVLVSPFTADVNHIWDGVVIVAISGEIDFAGSSELARRLGLVDGSTPPHIVLDLSEVVFIDASGIRALIVSARAIEAREGSFTLAAPRSHVERVFGILRLAETVAIEQTLASALARARSSAARSASDG